MNYYLFADVVCKAHTFGFDPHAWIYVVHTAPHICWRPWMTVMAFLLSAPLILSVDGIKFSPSYLQSAVSVASLEKQEILQYFNSSLIWNCWILNLLRLQGVNIKELCVRVALAGTCCSFYEQVRPVFTRKHFCGLSAVAKIVCCLLPRLAT